MNYSKLILAFIATIIFIFKIVPPVSAAEASLTFSPENLTSSVNTTFSISIMLDTSGYPSGGVDAIITFDPASLTAISVKPGIIFADYPMAAIDNTHGKITISGIASSPNNLYVGEGIFATINFQASSLGKTNVMFLFKPGSTTDSNIAVTFGNGDVLAKVNQLSVTTTPSYVDSTPTTLPTILTKLRSFSFSTLKANFDTFLASLDIPFLRDKYAVARSGRPVSKRLDPLDPIVAQSPITDAINSQPITTIANITQSSFNYLPYIFIGLGTILMIFLVIYSHR